MEYNLKEQLFDKINGLKITNPNIKETWFNLGVKDAYERVEMFFNKELVPEVPQYVADWYEANKDDFEGKLFKCIDCIPSVYDEGDLNEFEEWIIDGETKTFQTLVNMHQFGYKVEKVDLYRVKLIHGGQYLHTETFGDTYFTSVAKSVYSKDKLSNLGFDWVFNCPGIKLEEVE